MGHIVDDIHTTKFSMDIQGWLLRAKADTVSGTQDKYSEAKQS